MMAYGNENFAGAAFSMASQPAQESAFKRWHDAIAEMADQIAVLGEDARHLADEIFGSVPQAIAKHADLPEPNSHVSALEGQIARLRRNHGNLLEEFGRLKQLS